MKETRRDSKSTYAAERTIVDGKVDLSGFDTCAQWDSVSMRYTRASFKLGRYSLIASMTHRNTTQLQGTKRS